MERFQLPDDLLGEILLRLPPQQPSCLVRASLVCKHWRALVTDPRFISRLRPLVLGAYLNPSPMLGDFIRANGRPYPTPALQFFPPGHRWSLVRDCRRGLVLLSVLSAAARSLLVWDPVSHDKQLVPQPPVNGRYANGFALVLLLRDNHSSHGFFRIAAAYVGDDGVAVAAVYSSRAGAWGSHVTAKAPVASGSSMLRMQKHGAAVGDAAAYWLLNDGRILSLDLQEPGQVLTFLQPRNAPRVFDQNAQLMSTSNGKLELAAVTGASLRMWVLDHTDDGHGGGATSTWTLRRTIKLDTLLPGETDTSCRPRRPAPDDFRRVIRSQESKHDVDEQCDGDESTAPCARIVGVHDDGSVVILRRECVFFMLCVDETTPEVHRMFETFVTRHDFDTVYPYSSNIFSRAISGY